jgi:hypothetical protein
MKNEGEKIQVLTSLSQLEAITRGGKGQEKIKKMLQSGALIISAATREGLAKSSLPKDIIEEIQIADKDGRAAFRAEEFPAGNHFYSHVPEFLKKRGINLTEEQQAILGKIKFERSELEQILKEIDELELSYPMDRE